MNHEHIAMSLLLYDRQEAIEFARRKGYNQGTTHERDHTHGLLDWLGPGPDGDQPAVRLARPGLILKQTASQQAHDLTPSN